MLHGVHKTNNAHDTDNNIRDNKFIHISFDFNNTILNTRKPAAKTEPETNTGKLTSPEKPGMKKPITAEAISIFAISPKNFDSASN